MKKKTEATAYTWPRGVGAPAQRALAGAGITRLEQLAKWREADLIELHGMGPKALTILRDALHVKGIDFKR
jgi:predicted flap endonuclease-1-like 5' DNA nuclease